MTTQMNFVLLFVFGLTLGCAPKIQKREYQNPTVHVGPNLADQKVEILNENTRTPILWDSNVKSAQVLSTSESLIHIGEQSNNPKLRKLGDQLSSNFYNSKGVTTSTSLEASPYMQVALAEIGPLVKDRINDGINMLRDHSELIHQLFVQSKTSYQWNLDLNFEDAISQIDLYMTTMIQSMIEKHVNSKIVDKISLEKESTLHPLINEAIQKFHTIRDSESLSQMLNQLQDTIKYYLITLEPEQQKKLQEAQVIGATIDGMKAAEDGLGIIITFWKKMTPQERLDHFVSENKELYDYLLGKNDSDLDCLATPGCFGPVLSIGKHKIYKQLREVGVENLRLKFNKSTMAYAMSKTPSIYPLIFQKVPDEIDSKIQSAITENKLKFINIHDNFSTFFADLIKVWGQQNLFNSTNSTLTGVELSQVHILKSKGEINFKPLDNNVIQTSTEGIGNSLSLMSLKWKSASFNPLNVKSADNTFDKSALMKSVLEQVNKMLAMIGFHKENNDVFPSFVIPLNPHQSARNFIFDYSLISEPKSLFAFPDIINIQGAYEPDKTIVQNQISVRSQAELLRGVSNMMEFFKDWKTSVYDETLGQVKIRDFNLEWIPEEMRDFQLFPKESMFALAVGNSMVVLQSLIKEMSPVFLISTNGIVSWSNERSSNSDNQDVKAGVVDIVDGQRTSIVRTSDLAKYLMALIQFYQSSEGIESSHAKVLNQLQADGYSLAQKISKMRGDIKNLIIGVSNYLSNDLKDKDGGFLHSLSIADIKADKSQTAITVDKTLEDQANGIRALLMASQFTGLKLYEWSAIEAYYFMNRNLWNAKIGYYSSLQNGDKVDYADFTTALESLVQLQNILHDDSLTQLNNIISISSSRLVDEI